MSVRNSVPVIGLIGGVGSGKSALTRFVADHRQIQVIDGDRAGHQVLDHSNVKEQLRSRFGSAVFDKQGDVVRPALGRVVFGPSAEHRSARADLERIVHPEIRKMIEGRIAQARDTNDIEAVVLDAAVLLEAGWDDMCDAIVFVETPHEQRLERVAENRGWTQEMLAAREASQYSLDVKRNASHFVVQNSGTVPEAGRCLNQIIEQIIDNSAGSTCENRQD